MKVENNIICALVFPVFFFASMLEAVTLGSDTLSSRQNQAYFPASHTNNKMFGFSVFEQGFVLEDATTTCTFDAFFPVSGNVTLNGGTLYLARDLVLKNPLSIGVGTICGHGNAVEFPRNESTFDFPTDKHTKLLNLLDSSDIGEDVNAIDWSFDDQYLAVVSNTAAGLQELKVYSFDGQTLTLVASYDPGSSDVHAVRWHPSDYYLAIGLCDTQELMMLHLNTSTHTLSQTDNVIVGDVHSVAWKPSGDYIAVGKKDDSTILMYSVNDGLLGFFYEGEFENDRVAQENALDWDPTGCYLAVGLGQNNIYTEVKIFFFDGAELILNAELDVDASVKALQWSPAGSWLAIGKSAGDKRLEVCKHDAIAGTLTQKVQAGENKSIYGLHWSSDGSYLTMGRDEGFDHMELRVLAFNEAALTLNLVSGYEVGAHTRAVRWAHSGNYLASGGTGDTVRVFNFTEQPFIFHDAQLFFNSDATFRGSVHFKGSCVLNGGGHILDLGNVGQLVVAEGATLTIENAIIKGISGTNMRCTDNVGSIMLRDVVWLQDNDFTFSVGALQFKNNVNMAGSGAFVYQSNQTSTIRSKSTLTLDVGFTFRYEAPSNDGLAFEDGQSLLRLNGATLHTSSGINFKGGKIEVLRDSFFSSASKEASESITLGNGNAAGNVGVD